MRIKQIDSRKRMHMLQLVAILYQNIQYLDWRVRCGLPVDSGKFSLALDQYESILTSLGVKF